MRAGLPVCELLTSAEARCWHLTSRKCCLAYQFIHLAEDKAISYSEVLQHPPMRELSSRRRFLRKAAFAGGGALLGTVQPEPDLSQDLA